MKPEVELARAELELARSTSRRLWKEHADLAKALDPAREVATPEEIALLKEASDWTERVYAAERALFVAEHGGPGIVGTHGAYEWLSHAECDISALLKACPEVVLNRYLAVTSFDSGALHPTDQEKSEGWWTAEDSKVFRGSPWGNREDRDDWKVAYSPRLQSIHGLPDETRGRWFNEWYVFDQPTRAAEIEVFVNWGGFRLNAPEYEGFAKRLWEQMERLSAESYLSEGVVFTFATRNRDLFRGVISRLIERG